MKFKRTSTSEQILYQDITFANFVFVYLHLTINSTTIQSFCIYIILYVKNVYYSFCSPVHLGLLDAMSWSILFVAAKYDFNKR